MSNEYNDGQENDDHVAGILSDAMSSRMRQFRSTSGSVTDVHHRARRITRRRTAIGAGALAAVGAVGALAVASRGGDDDSGRRIVAGGGGLGGGVGGGGDGGGGDAADSAAPAGAGGYWECTGPLGPWDPNVPVPLSTLYPTPSMLPTVGTLLPPVAVEGSTIPPPSIVLPSTTVSPISPTSTVPPEVESSTTLDGSQYSTTSTLPDAAVTSTVFDGGLFPVPSSIVIGPDGSLVPIVTYVPAIGRDGVFYMQDCKFVLSTDDPSPDTGPSVEPVPATAVVTDSTVLGGSVVVPGIGIPTDTAVADTVPASTSS
jgi:hypothetical protein